MDGKLGSVASGASGSFGNTGLAGALTNLASIGPLGLGAETTGEAAGSSLVSGFTFWGNVGAEAATADSVGIDGFSAICVLARDSSAVIDFCCARTVDSKALMDSCCAFNMALSSSTESSAMAVDILNNITVAGNMLRKKHNNQPNFNLQRFQYQIVT